MARTPFKVEILTPEGEVFNDEVEMVSTKTSVGSIGLLANHQPLLAMLDPTELRLYKSESDVVRYAQGEGFLQIVGEHALVLVDEVFEVDKLDRSDLEDRLKRAEQEHFVVHDLQVALGLREADNVGLRLVEPELRRLEHAHQRRVVGQDAQRPHGRARRDHLDLVVEDLSLRGQDLGAKRLGH